MHHVLTVGDVHATVSELDDCQALIDFVYQIAKTRDCSILFLGDLYDKHDAMSVRVMSFWRQAIKKLDKVSNVPVEIVLGNHDQSNTVDNHPNALEAHYEGALVHDSAHDCTSDGIAYLPYQKDVDTFLIQAKILYDKGAKTLICHQTFDGSQYENGFYAEDSVPIDGIVSKFDKVISGHIHLRQSFANIHYVGSPRWRTKSDAGISKFIDLWRVEDSVFTHVEAFDTSAVCRQIFVIKDTPEEPLDETKYNPTKDLVHVAVHGPETYCKEKVLKLRSLGFVARAFRTRAQVSKVRESDGIDVAWKKFCEGYRAPNGTPISTLIAMSGM